MYSKIFNPETGRKVLTNSKIGKTILKKYITSLYGGASTVDSKVLYTDINPEDFLDILNRALLKFYNHSDEHKFGDDDLNVFTLTNINNIINKGYQVLQNNSKIDLGCNKLCMSIAIINYTIYLKSLSELNDLEKVYIFLLYFLVKDLHPNIYLDSPTLIDYDLDYTLQNKKRYISVVETDLSALDLSAAGEENELLKKNLLKKLKRSKKTLAKKKRNLKNFEQSVSKIRSGDLTELRKIKTGNANICIPHHCKSIIQQLFGWSKEKNIRFPSSETQEIISAVFKFCKNLSQCLKGIVWLLLDYYNQERFSYAEDDYTEIEFPEIHPEGIVELSTAYDSPVIGKTGYKEGIDDTEFYDRPITPGNIIMPKLNCFTLFNNNDILFRTCIYIYILRIKKDPYTDESEDIWDDMFEGIRTKIRDNSRYELIRHYVKPYPGYPQEVDNEFNTKYGSNPNKKYIIVNVPVNKWGSRSGLEINPTNVFLSSICFMLMRTPDSHTPDILEYLYSQRVTSHWYIGTYKHAKELLLGC